MIRRSTTKWNRALAQAASLILVSCSSGSPGNSPDVPVPQEDRRLVRPQHVLRGANSNRVVVPLDVIAAAWENRYPRSEGWSLTALEARMSVPGRYVFMLYDCRIDEDDDVDPDDVIGKNNDLFFLMDGILSSECHEATVQFIVAIRGSTKQDTNGVLEVLRIVGDKPRTVGRLILGNSTLTSGAELDAMEGHWFGFWRRDDDPDGMSWLPVKRIDGNPLPLLFNLYRWSWNGPGSSLWLSGFQMARPNAPPEHGLIGMNKNDERLFKMKINEWPQPAYALNMLFLPDGT